MSESGSKNFYIADTHFGHAKVIEMDGRPFSDVEDMERQMVSNWNEVVGQDDMVYILGDFIWSRKEEDWLRLVKQLSGHKVLIRGNHDLKQMSKELRNQFADFKDFKTITDQGRHVILCHYPMLLYKADYNPHCYMLCGHVHNTRENGFLEKWRQELRDTRSVQGHSWGQVYNVGCMMPWMGYTPRTLDEILEWEERAKQGNYVIHGDQVAFHPGFYIQELIEEGDASEGDFAKMLGISTDRFLDILHGRQAVTPDIAEGLANVVGPPASYWLNLQQAYDKAIDEWKEVDSK